MKKRFLLASLILTSQASFGQLTQSNEPAIGASSLMYVVDTGAVTMASVSSVTGTGVTWDYSTVNMNMATTQAIAVSDAASTPNASEFPTSVKAITQGTILQYFNSTATERVAQGFVFTDPTFGEVVVVFDTDEAIQMTYPFNYGSTSTDAYVGSTEINVGVPTTATVTGQVYSIIDGTGTLKLPDVDLTNLFRLTTMDTTLVNAGFTSVEVIRTQHEYYDLADQDLPIFVDAYISISGLGEQRQVLSKNFSTVGLKNNTINDVVLYPNPSNGEFTISGDFAKGTVEVIDLSGRTVYSSKVTAGASVKLKEVKSGMYTVKLAADGKTSVQKITIK